MLSPCIQVNTLPEFCMIAGNNETLIFSVYDEHGEPLDLYGSQPRWTLAPYGQMYHTVLDLEGIIQDNLEGGVRYKFIVPLNSGLTRDLEHGKYIQQPTIIDVHKREVRLGQGIITLLSRIPFK